jgi:hypothetical protein
MAKSEKGRTVETPTEARQAEPGPSVRPVRVLELANKRVALRKAFGREHCAAFMPQR